MTDLREYLACTGDRFLEACVDSADPAIQTSGVASVWLDGDIHYRVLPCFFDFFSFRLDRAAPNSASVVSRL